MFGFYKECSFGLNFKNIFLISLTLYIDPMDRPDLYLIDLMVQDKLIMLGLNQDGKTKVTPNKAKRVAPRATLFNDEWQ